MSDRADEVQVRYDADHDVLYLSLGEPRPAYGVPDECLDNLVVRYDPTTHAVVGVTIIGFKRTSQKDLQARLPFPVDFRRFRLA